MHSWSARSIGWGVAGAAAMAAFYTTVVVWANGWSHLASQVRLDWYFLAAIIAGFGVQVAIMVELRHRHAMHATDAAAGGAGAGASTAGMLACCAHHLADIAPLVGATGAATFLANYRIPFMIAGIALNAIGIGVGVHRLRRTPAVKPAEEMACAA